jgi:hypothetical protein
MLSSLPNLQKERGFPHPSRKKKLLKFKRESTRWVSLNGLRTYEASPRYLPTVTWRVGSQRER